MDYDFIFRMVYVGGAVVLLLAALLGFLIGRWS